MEYGQMMNEAKDNAKLAFYQNPGYQFERRGKKTVILDVSSPKAGTLPTEFNVKLLEPLIVDRLSDVYLDAFITTNAIINTLVKNIGFTLKINEFNINSNVASNQDKTPTGGYDSRKFNSIFIPNAATDTKTVSHKAKKFNYIASINPCTISSLSGEILDAGSITESGDVGETGAPVYSSAFNSGSRFIAEFMIVARD
jgi:hypothetical protein